MGETNLQTIISNKLKMKIQNALLFVGLSIVCYIQDAGAFCFSNPRHSWRLKQDLDMDWKTAKKAFKTVFSSPFNTNFPTKVVSGLQKFTPLSDSAYVINFSKDGGKSNVTETISNYKATKTCASANAHMDSPGIGIMEDVEWFHAIDEHDGIVSYYFGFKSCKARRSDGQALPVHFSSQVCNEQNIGTFILTSVKRRACILENYNKANAIQLCENLEVATGH